MTSLTVERDWVDGVVLGVQFLLAIGTLLLALLTRKLARATRDQAVATRQEVETAVNQVEISQVQARTAERQLEVTRQLAIDALEGALDATAPVVTALPRLGGPPLADEPRDNVADAPFAHDQIFEPTRDPEKQIWLKGYVALANEGTRTAIVTLGSNLRFVRDANFFNDPSSPADLGKPWNGAGMPIQLHQDTYAIGPGQTFCLLAARSRPAREWAAAWQQRHDEPSTRELDFAVTVTSQHDAGVVDTIEIIVAGLPLRPEADDDPVRWRLNRDVAQAWEQVLVCTIQPIQRRHWLSRREGTSL